MVWFVLAAAAAAAKRCERVREGPRLKPPWVGGGAGEQVGSGSRRRYSQGFLMPGAPLYADSNAFKFITLPPVPPPPTRHDCPLANAAAAARFMTNAWERRRSWLGRRTS
jgi:hypothetical protein